MSTEDWIRDELQQLVFAVELKEPEKVAWIANRIITVVTQSTKGIFNKAKRKGAG